MSSSAEDLEGKQTCEFKKNLETLRQISFFSSLPLEVLKILAYLCEKEQFQEGDFLCHQGEDDGQAFYFLSGNVCLLHLDENKEEHKLKAYGAGDFVGGLSLMGTMHRLFSLQATTTVDCLILTRQKFSRAMEQFPELRPKVAQSLLDRIYEWEKQLFSEPADERRPYPGHTGVSLL